MSVVDVKSSFLHLIGSSGHANMTAKMVYQYPLHSHFPSSFIPIFFIFPSVLGFMIICVFILKKNNGFILIINTYYSYWSISVIILVKIMFYTLKGAIGVYYSITTICVVFWYYYLWKSENIQRCNVENSFW